MVMIDRVLPRLNAIEKYVHEATSEELRMEHETVLEFLLYFNAFESVFKPLAYDDSYSDSSAYENLDEHYDDMTWKKRAQICDELLPPEKKPADKYRAYARYFAKRYISNGGEIKPEYKTFSKCEEVYGHLLNVLIEALPSDYFLYPGGMRDEYKVIGVKHSTLYYYLEIAYRYRNNLMHGVKGIDSIHEYTEEFKQINKFMQLFLSDLRRNPDIIEQCIKE